MIWYNDLNDGIILSTRIRLARNIDKTPFPSKLNDKKKVREMLSDSILKSNSTLSKDFTLYELSKLSQSEKTAMTEEHLISPQMINDNEGAVLVNKDKTMSDIAREYGITRTSITQWRKKYGTITTSTGEVTNNDEILKLKKELKEKEIEIEILKKAVAIFSKK